MAELPTLIAIAARYKEQAAPVAFLGMYTVPDMQSARLVSDQLHIPFPTLDASKLWQRYHANTWPTLMVVDGDGILRHVQIGDAEDLDSTLSSILEGLIKSP